jgi:glucosylceramidase
VLAFALVVCVVGATVGVVVLATPPKEVNWWLTSGRETDVRLASQVAFELRVRPGWAGAGETDATVVVSPHRRYQVMEGFGAALTDSAAYLLHETLTAEVYNDTMDALFCPTTGAGLSHLRVVMGASDCARSWYTYCDEGPDLTGFSVAPDEEYILPVLRDALVRNPELRVLATPFSAPGWMKTGNDLSNATWKGLVGGRLRADMYDLYAEYFVRFVQAYAAAGVPVHAVTLQNEPFHEPPDYPGMLMNATEQARLASLLGPAFAAAGLSTEVFILDHNWDLENEALAVLADPAAQPHVSGVAWHGYSWPPDPGAQARVRDRYPDTKQFFTEVTGFWAAPVFADNLGWLNEHILVGGTQNWASAVLLWNLALDDRGGPILRDYHDMRGVVTIAAGGVTKEVEYYALAHFSRFVPVGSHRIGCQVSGDQVVATAFETPDGLIVTVVANLGGTEARVTLSGGIATAETDCVLPPQSVATFVWKK